VQFTKHGLLGVLATVYAALRELPRMGAYAFTPKNLISLVEQDDADIRPKAVAVEHNQTSKFLKTGAIMQAKTACNKLPASKPV